MGKIIGGRKGGYETIRVPIDEFGGMVKLTRRQEAFCNRYLENGRNGKQAAILAGYAVKGSGPYASNMLTFPPIAQRIKFLDENSLVQVTRTKIEMDLKAEQRARIKAAVLELGASPLEIAEALTEGWVLMKLVENALAGQESKNLTGSNQALIAIGKHIGMWADMRKGEGDGRTDDQVANALRAALGAIDRGNRETPSAEAEGDTKADREAVKQTGRGRSGRVLDQTEFSAHSL